MAKASPALLTGEINSNPAIAAAAAEIHTLINSQPRSPTKDELAGIIGKTISPSHPPAARSALHAEIERVAREYIGAMDDFDASEADDESDPRVDALQDPLHELEGQLPRTSCSVADVTAWAQITHAFACEETDDDREPYLYKGNADRVAVGHLVKAVLGLAAVAAPVGVPKLHEFLTRVVAKVVPGDSREKAVEEKDDALSHAARTQARRILTSPIKTPLDLDARAWLVLLASDFTFSIEAMVKRRRAVRSAGASTVSALISQGLPRTPEIRRDCRTE